MSAALLRTALADHGGTLASLLTGPDGGPERVDPRPGLDAPGLAARGPRAAGRERDYELLLEMILEGSLLHYGRPRVVLTEDRDLALLLGDQLYALGLAKLAALGDLPSVTELADLISLLSQAQLADDPELARAIWRAGAVAVGWGTTAEHDAAKALAREGDARASRALIECSGRAVDGEASAY